MRSDKTPRAAGAMLRATMRAFLTSALALSVACAHPEQPRPTTPTSPGPDGLSAFLEGQMRARQIPGLQIAIVRHGEIVLLASYGLASIQDAVPVTNHTVFTVNSMTKAFTGVAMMQLVEAGQVGLDAPISRYLEGLPVAWQAVPIRRLLDQTSGLPVLQDGDEQLFANANGGEDAAWAKLSATPVEAAPGTRFAYNATNYLLLRRIVEQLTHRSFTEFVAERQWRVVGMPRTRFGDALDVIPNIARGYYLRHDVDAAGRRADALANVFEQYPPFFRAASGACSTAEDFARWAIALQRGRLLRAASLTTLWTAGTLNDGSSVGFSRLLNGYALGWLTVRRSEHRAMAAIGGARNALFIYPDDDFAIVILTNRRAGFPEAFIDEVAGYYIPDMRIATGFGLPPAIKPLHVELTKRGFAHAPEVVAEMQRTDPGFRLAEAEVNAWGYRVLELGQPQQAVEIFKLNVGLYPESANAFDSLGEGYEAAGAPALAIPAYRRSLALNPKNTHAVEQLEALARAR